ncbi:hypothetical protein I314_00103 [Cryptococcus bacillisporus CA1873]|uniref:Uncharacterized protein n=1 Tax=Cryptococcus bacillisporus CA1873 TaxID=1296111 RepID=A0ABR5BIJ8_CRYGA|nr:hypothetical protein I314_00103 [Cryptococcus bacillisporus CA1873]|eukprot:KIR69001.1 hypothetical protein I314_00103 [Cryptococcus gattii CA1873]
MVDGLGRARLGLRIGRRTRVCRGGSWDGTVVPASSPPISATTSSNPALGPSPNPADGPESSSSSSSSLPSNPAENS